MPKQRKSSVISPPHGTWRHKTAIAVGNAFLLPLRVVLGVALVAHFSDE